MGYYFFKIINKIIAKGHLPRTRVKQILGNLMSKHVRVEDKPINLCDEKDVNLSPLYIITPPQLSKWHLR